MAQSYTRQSTFADGDTITATLFNNEYNQLVNVFAYSDSSAATTGHRHDGTAAQGGNIPQIGDLDFKNKIVVDSTNNRWGVFVEVSGTAVEQIRIQDGAIVPVTDSDIDLGTSSLEFKDLFLDGTAHIDTLDVDVNATIAGTLGVTGAATLSSTLAVTGAVTGSSTIQGTTITATTAFVPDASDGASLGGVNLQFSDLFLADGALLAFGDDQDVTITHLEDAGLLLNGARGLFFNDTTQYINAPSGTVLDIAATDEIELTATLIDINGAVDISGNLDVGGNLVVTGTTTFNGGTLTLGDAASDNVVFGADVNSSIIPNTDATFDLGSSSQEWRDLYVDGTAYVDAINFNGTAISATAEELNIMDGVTATTAELNIMDGVTSTAAEINILDGVTSTAAELNILDGVTSTAAEINLLDGVTSTTAELNILDGVTATAAEINILDGVTSTATELNLLDGVTSTTAELNILDGVTATAADINLIDGITNGTVIASKAIITDANKDISGGRNITISGELDAGSLDISGDVDVDGTLEADAITIAGITLAETISDTVGAMVTSNTESGITVAYDDSDNTLDFTVGTLNQDTTGNAATATALETARTIGGVSFDGTANITPTTFTTATFSGDVNVDSGVLFADVSANRVGINQASPDVSLDLGANTDAVHIPVGTTAQRPGSPAAGYFRYNASLSQFEGYTDAWGAIGGGGTNTFTHDVFTCNGSTTAFALSQSTESENNLIVFIDGVFQEQGAYSIATSSGTTTLTLSAAPVNGRKLVVYSVAAGVSGSNLNIDSMTGDGSDTTLTLSINPVNENNTQVFVDGVYQSKSNYSISGTTLTFSTAPPTGSAVEVMTMTQTDVNVPVDGTITSAKLSGDLVTPSSLTVTGDLITTTSGTSNFVAGVNAGNSIASGGNYNVVLGDEAGTAITTGDQNVLLGYGAGDAIVSSSNNVAVGNLALSADTLGGRSVAIGASALTAQNFTSSTNAYNVAIGFTAGAAITTGVQNTIIGSLAGDAMTTGNRNTALGYSALSSDTLGDRNVAIGNLALQTQNFTSSTDSYNTAVGYNAGGVVTTGIQNTLIGGLAGDAITTASYNTAVGYTSLSANTTGVDNVAIGWAALGANTTGSDNVAVGKQALDANTTGATNTALGDRALTTNTTASNNTAVGADALYANTTGSDNVVVGAVAGDALTTGSDNVVVGKNALSADTTGRRSVAIGRSALSAQNFTSTTSSYNVAVGYEAGGAVTTGTINTLIGGLSGEALTTGNSNVAVGYNSLKADTAGDRNVAIGVAALQSQNFTSTQDTYNIGIGYGAGSLITTGLRNTAVGSLSLDKSTTGSYNTALGYGTLSSQTATGDAYNTAIGYNAGVAITTGVKNVIVGALAADSMTTGSENTIIGNGAAGNGVISGSNNTALGRSAGLSLTTGGNNLLLGHDSGITGSPGGNINTESNRVCLGDENITHIYAQVQTISSSDERDKTDFTALDLGLDFVKALAPVTYKWDKRSKYGDKFAEDYDLNAQTPDGTHKEDWLDIGFKAQSVVALEEAAGYTISDKTNLVSSLTEDGKQYGLQYENFIPILVKAIQELSTQNAALTARIAALEE